MIAGQSRPMRSTPRCCTVQDPPRAVESARARRYQPWRATGAGCAAIKAGIGAFKILCFDADDGIPTNPCALTVKIVSQQRMFSETHSAQGDMLIRDIIARMRHDGCGGRAGKVELLTGIEGASSRPVRRIVLTGG